MKIQQLLESNENANYLYRGIKPRDPRDPIPDTITVIPDDKQNRNPKSTSVFIHNLVNALTYERFGVYVRNLPFFYSNKKSTRYYGSIFRVEVTNEMTFYYADDIFDFTINLDAVRYHRLIASTLMHYVLKENNKITPDDDFKKMFFNALIPVCENVVLTTLEFNNVKELNEIYGDIGEKVFKVMIRNGYENEDNKKMVVDMVVNGIKGYFNKFYKYAQSVKKTKSYNDIPEKVEIMVDAPMIKLQKIEE